MFKFLFVLFSFFVLLVLLMGFSVLRTLKNILFGGGQNMKSSRQKQQRQENKRQPSSRKKIFGRNEGEYVDYEEVKD
ncbi:MAG: DUF4834 family protein [Bacteroidales bacterium]